MTERSPEEQRKDMFKTMDEAEKKYRKEYKEPKERMLDIAIKPPDIAAREFLSVMDEAVKDCDISLFSLYMANVYSHAERAYNKGRISEPEVRSLKELAAVKVTNFLENCKCTKR